MKQLQNKKRIGDGVRRISSEIKIESISISKEKSSWLKSTLKVFGAGILTAGLSSSLVMVGSTVSFFNDTETSSGNFMKAEPLSFIVEIASSTSAIVDLTSGKGSVPPIMSPLDGTDVIQYQVKGSFAGGDSDLCNAINTLGTFPFPLDGNLSTFVSGTTTSTGAWTLDFNLPDPSLFPNKSCIVNLVYEGWNTSLPYGTGFKDARTVSITFNVGDTTPLLIQSFVSDLPEVPAPLIVVPEESKTGDAPPPTEENNTPPPSVEDNTNKNTNTNTNNSENVVPPPPVVPPTDTTPEVVTGPTTDDPALLPVETTETPAE